MARQLVEKSGLENGPDHEVHFSFTGCPTDPPDGMSIGYFLEGLFGPESDVPLTPTLKGMFEDPSRNFFFVAEVDRQIIASCWYLTGASSPELSVLGEVYTRPDYRRKGISRKLCDHALQHFINSGGKAMLLGSNNPAAIDMYFAMGFQPYPEGLMRYTVGAPGDFDSACFDPAQSTRIREIQHGDIPGIANLIGTPNDWISVCYPIGLFSSSHQSQARCVSFYTLLKKAADQGGGLFALASDGGGVMGIGTLLHQGNRLNPGSALVDVFVHPAFRTKADDLIESILQSAKVKGIAEVRAEILAAEHEKIVLLEKHGFRQSCNVGRRETLGDKTYRVVSYLRTMG